MDITFAFSDLPRRIYVRITPVLYSVDIHCALEARCGVSYIGRPYARYDGAQP